jgi:hypothetical protein
MPIATLPPIAAPRRLAMAWLALGLVGAHHTAEQPEPPVGPEPAAPQSVAAVVVDTPPPAVIACTITPEEFGRMLAHGLGPDGVLDTYDDVPVREPVPFSLEPPAWIRKPPDYLDQVEARAYEQWPLHHGFAFPPDTATYMAYRRAMRRTVPKK